MWSQLRVKDESGWTNEISEGRALWDEVWQGRKSHGGRGSTENNTDQKNQKKQKNPLIHARNSPTDVDTLYNLILTEIHKVSIIVPILQVNKLELSN